MLAYDYALKRALLQDPAGGETSPHLYALCHPCAERLRPPRGWTLEDRRVEPVLFLDEDEEVAGPSHNGSVETNERAEARPLSRRLFFVPPQPRP